MGGTTTKIPARLATFLGLWIVGLIPVIVVAITFQMAFDEIDANAPGYATYLLWLLFSSWLCLRVFEQQPLAAVGIFLDRRVFKDVLDGVLIAGAVSLSIWALLTVTTSATTRVNDSAVAGSVSALALCSFE